MYLRIIRIKNPNLTFAILFTPNCCVYVYVCVRVGVCADTCLDGCEHVVCSHMWRSKGSLRCLLSGAIHLVFETMSLIGLQLTSKAKGSTCLPLC